MGRLGDWTLFFSLLLILVQSLGHSTGDHGTHALGSSMDVITLQWSWAFKMEDMKAGARKSVYFPTKEESVNGEFIPRDIADSIPFSLKELPKIMDLFKGTKEAAYVESALAGCERPPASEVFKGCFSSFESMLETISLRVFNASSSNNNPGVTPKVMTSVFRGPHETSFQNYTVLEEPREVATTGMAGCHAMIYPYTLFYCHAQPGENKVFQIPLLGERDGVLVDAVAVCHLDTSQWDPDNWLFRMLGTKRGDPACHFFAPYDNFAWVQTPTNSALKASA